MEHPFASDASYVLRFPHGLLRSVGEIDMLANQKQWHSRRYPVSQIDEQLEYVVMEDAFCRSQCLIKERKRAERSMFH